MQKYTVTSKVHLVNDSYAVFYTKFHPDGTGHADGTGYKADPLHKKITQICTMHKQMTRADDIFKSPYDNMGFHFKVEPYVKCTDRHKKPCIIDNLHDTDVQMIIKIIPYDLIDKLTQQRRVGVTCKVISINQI